MSPALTETVGLAVKYSSDPLPPYIGRYASGQYLSVKLAVLRNKKQKLK